MRDKRARSKGDGSVLYLSDVIKYLDTVSKVQNKTVPFCRASGWNPFYTLKHRWDVGLISFHGKI